MTDHCTDELFAVPSTLATTVASPVSRVVVNPERFTDDEREPMARAPTSPITPRSPRPSTARSPHTTPAWCSTGTASRRARCLRGRPGPGPGGHLPRHRREPHARVATRRRGGRLRGAGLERGERPPVRRRARADALLRQGPPGAALMIEVRRGLYMDERSGARGPAFDRVRERLAGALRTIAGAFDGMAASRSPRLSNL